MSKNIGKLHGVRMGLRSAIRRTKRHAVKKNDMDLVAPQPNLSMAPKLSINSYLRQKKKKKKDPEETGITLMPAVSSTTVSTVKSEVMEDFRPKFHEIKELIKASPELAMSCLPANKVKKNDMATPPPESPPSDDTPDMPASVTGSYNKAQMGMKPKMPSMPSAGGVKSVAPKAPAAPTPTPPKGPSPQMVSNKPKGMAGAPMGKEEKGKAPVAPLKPKTKEPPTLNYAEMNKPKAQAGKVNTIDYRNLGDVAPQPKRWETGLALKRQARANETVAKHPGVKKEEMGKGDVVAIASGRVIDSDKNPKHANPHEIKNRVAKQHKASQYTPMKPAPVRADGTRVNKAEKGKEIKRPDGPQVGKEGNWPVKEQGKQKGKEGLNIVTPPEGTKETKKGESCAYKPSAMIKEELAQKWEPKFKKDVEDGME